jgi:hypothetical protein
MKAVYVSSSYLLNEKLPPLQKITRFGQMALRRRSPTLVWITPFRRITPAPTGIRPQIGVAVNRNAAELTRFRPHMPTC